MRLAVEPYRKPDALSRGSWARHSSEGGRGPWPPSLTSVGTLQQGAGVVVARVGPALP